MAGRGRSNPGTGFGAPRYPGAFLLAFREAATRVGLRVDAFRKDLAHCLDENGKLFSVGVENIFRRVRREERENWLEVIAEFLQTIREAESSGGQPPGLADSADRLLLRLGHPMKLGKSEDAVWHWPIDNTDLVVNLVIDFSNRMCYVTESMVHASEKSGEYWLTIARRNLESRTPPDCLDEIHGESGLCCCNVGDAYDSSRALLAEQLLPSAGEHGVLVILPGRDELLVLPVALQAIPYLHVLKAFAERDFKSAPYPISDQVYWIRDGTWRIIPIELRGKEVVVQPPMEFIEVLNRLAPPTESSEHDQDSEDAD
jgi:hypothetical protein